MSRPTRRRTAVLSVALLAVASCGADEPVRFQADGAVQLECMQHQSDPPGPDYTDPERADLGRNLTVFKYYSLNGATGYCDGSGPRDADRAWAEFVAAQTGTDRTVSAILG